MDYYVTKEGDQWDAIALAVYGRESAVIWLMQNNGAHLSVYQFPAGVKLSTPALPEEQAASLPPWRKGGANAD